jgi:biotin carboxyl carrier protein
MKYVVTHDGREFAIELSPKGNGRHVVTCDGRSFEVDLAPAGGRSIWSVVIDRAAFDVAVVRQKDQAQVTIHGREVALTVESEQARNARLVEGTTKPHGPHTIQSVMPGRVVRVLVREGEPVVQGTALLILEAMKMENEIRSAGGGTVSKILVAAGQTVINGDPLLVIE